MKCNTKSQAKVNMGQLVRSRGRAFVEGIYKNRIALRLEAAGSRQIHCDDVISACEAQHFLRRGVFTRQNVRTLTILADGHETALCIGTPTTSNMQLDARAFARLCKDYEVKVLVEWR